MAELELNLGSLLSYIDTDLVEDDFVKTDTVQKVYAKIPEKYEVLPSFPEIQGLQRWTREEIERYFVPKDLDIRHMDGELPNHHVFSYCDKCKGDLTENFYHYECWSEKGLDNYLEYNLCMPCAEKFPYILKLYNFTQPSTNNNKNNGMGSIFSWIPIYRDEEYNSILYCAVKDEAKYGKLALMSYDDHGRTGMYTVKEDFDTLKRELEELYRGWLKDYPPDECSWDKVYNLPIKLAMNKRGFEYHYG